MLWLLRHGNAASGSPDAERPLTAKGRDQSRAAGLALRALGIELDACLTSPKIRARETAALACEPFVIEPATEERLAGGEFDPHALAAGLGKEVLLVGHDPDFSRAVRELSGARVSMKKGGLAAIDGRELIVLLRPRELRRIAAGG